MGGQRGGGRDGGAERGREKGGGGEKGEGQKMRGVRRCRQGRCSVSRRNLWLYYLHPSLAGNLLSAFEALVGEASMQASI
jgi:hypothetical protein